MDSNFDKATKLHCGEFSQILEVEILEHKSHGPIVAKVVKFKNNLFYINEFTHTHFF